MPEGPLITITVVLYKSEDVIPPLLECLNPLVVSGVAEVLLVDNASPDNSAAVAKQICPAATLLHAQKNLGFAGGCNLAWPHVRGKYWLLLNPDTAFQPESFIDLAHWMEAYPRVGAASPRILNMDNQPVYLSLRFPSITKGLVNTLRLHKLLPRAWRARALHLPHDTVEQYLLVDWIPGTAMMVKREAVEQAGLLRENYFMYCEDVEWCWRIRKAGWDVAVYTPATVKHIGGTASRGSTSREKARRFVRNCFEVDTVITGRLRATVLLLIRMVDELLLAVDWRKPIDVRRYSWDELMENVGLLAHETGMLKSKCQ